MIIQQSESKFIINSLLSNSLLTVIYEKKKNTFVNCFLPDYNVKHAIYNSQ